MKQISIKSLGQLERADISFGDMTIFVGQQASGKTILLELIKLILDSDNITTSIKRYGFNWQKNPEIFLSLYFGGGMEGIWNDATNITVDGIEFDLEKSLSKRGRNRAEKLFLIPAHRVMTLRNGWPRPFTDYTTDDPYVVKKFSEHIRLLMEAGLGSGKGSIFPQRRIKKFIRDLIEEAIFGGAKLELDITSPRKRMMLDIEGQKLPFMAWSSGQREFVPLLLGLYWLLPPSSIKKRKTIDWVVIEEPEMGLHPQAVSALLLAFLELMNRGYKVIISTHSPQILEMVWGIQMLSEEKAPPEQLIKLFNLKPNKTLSNFAKTILEDKRFKTYYFSRRQNIVNVKDISTLDPEDADEAIYDWGGLTSFSTRVSEVVSNAV